MSCVPKFPVFQACCPWCLLRWLGAWEGKLGIRVLSFAAFKDIFGVPDMTIEARGRAWDPEGRVKGLTLVLCAHMELPIPNPTEYWPQTRLYFPLQAVRIACNSLQVLTTSDPLKTDPPPPQDALYCAPVLTKLHQEWRQCPCRTIRWWSLKMKTYLRFRVRNPSSLRCWIYELSLKISSNEWPAPNSLHLCKKENLFLGNREINQPWNDNEQDHNTRSSPQYPIQAWQICDNRASKKSNLFWQTLFGS